MNRQQAIMWANDDLVDCRIFAPLDLSVLTHWGWDKMATIFADIFWCNFMKEKFCIFFQVSLKFVPEGPVANKSVLVQVMAWHQTGDKPLSEPTVQWLGGDELSTTVLSLLH